MANDTAPFPAPISKSAPRGGNSLSRPTKHRFAMLVPVGRLFDLEPVGRIGLCKAKIGVSRGFPDAVGPEHQVVRAHPARCGDLHGDVADRGQPRDHDGLAEVVQLGLPKAVDQHRMGLIGAAVDGAVLHDALRVEPVGRGLVAGPGHGEGGRDRALRQTREHQPDPEDPDQQHQPEHAPAGPAARCLTHIGSHHSEWS